MAIVISAVGFFLNTNNIDLLHSVLFLVYISLTMIVFPYVIHAGFIKKRPYALIRDTITISRDCSYTITMDSVNIPNAVISSRGFHLADALYILWIGWTAVAAALPQPTTPGMIFVGAITAMIVLISGGVMYDLSTSWHSHELYEKLCPVSAACVCDGSDGPTACMVTSKQHACSCQWSPRGMCKAIKHRCSCVRFLSASPTWPDGVREDRACLYNGDHWCACISMGAHDATSHTLEPDAVCHAKGNECVAIRTMIERRQASADPRPPPPTKDKMA